MSTQQKTKKDVYSIVSETITNFLESGIIPWRTPWAEGRVPTNLITRNPYRGINVFLLAMHSFKCNMFMNESQLANIGGTLQNSELPLLAIHWDMVEKQSKDGEEKTEDKVPVLRYHKVVNVSQCEGINHDAIPGYERPAKPFEEAREIVKKMPNAPTIEFYKTSASFDPVSDVIFMPHSETYAKKENYYYDLFRMLAQSTGHEKRLNRQGYDTDINTLYLTREALVADMAAHYLCYHSGMESIELMDNLVCIHEWIDVFKAEAKFFVSAAIHAQKAVDCILNRNQ